MRPSLSDLQFFHFIIDSVISGDYAVHVARQALDGKDDRAASPRELLSSTPGERTQFLRANRQKLLEMFVSRLVDNFQKYIVNLIRDVLHSKPSMMSTRQQSISLEEILRHGSIETLMHDVIERKVNSLSYDGFSDLQKWCLERGIPIRVSNSRLQEVVELIATRNVIAHNRGVVDNRYVSSVRRSQFEVGSLRNINVDYFFNAGALLSRIVFQTDKAARKKFKLKTVKIEISAKQKTGTERIKRPTGEVVIGTVNSETTSK